jgi:hypothetical protein
MPSYARAMQKAGGYLFPFGFLHLLKAKRKNDTADFYLIGVLLNQPVEARNSPASMPNDDRV